MLKLVFQVILIALVIRHIKLTSLKNAFDQYNSHGPLSGGFVRKKCCVHKSKIYYPSRIEQQQIVELHNNVQQSQAKLEQRKVNLLKYNKELELLVACQLSRCSSEVDSCKNFQNVICDQNLQYYDLSHFNEISAFEKWINCSENHKLEDCPNLNKSWLRNIENKIHYLGCGIIKYSRGIIIACTYCPKDIQRNSTMYKRQIEYSEETGQFLSHFRKQRPHKNYDPKFKSTNVTWINPQMNENSNYIKNWKMINDTNEIDEMTRDDQKWIGRRQFSLNEEINTMDDDIGTFSGSVQQTDVEFEKFVLCVHALFIIILF